MSAIIDISSRGNSGKPERKSQDMETGEIFLSKIFTKNYIFSSVNFFQSFLVNFLTVIKIEKWKN